MKRILAILLAAMLLCCVFVACDEGEQPADTTQAATKAPTTEEQTTEPETTTEEETTDDGQPDLEDYYIDVWDDANATHNPQKIDETHKGVGIVITIPEGGYLYEATVQAPSYSDNIGNLSIKVFAWDTDYDTTVAGEPLQVDEFVDFTDNDTLVAEYDEGVVGAGKYLIVACDGVDEGEGVGVWTGKPFKEADLPEEYVRFNIESWINGKQSKKTIGKFSLVVTAPEEV